MPSVTAMWRVHPRSRGATQLYNQQMQQAQGPSPLTRGNPDCFRGGDHRRGSIPAHAGQPLRLWVLPQPIWVHPRSRGATASKMRLRSSRLGPSPLTRGNLVQPGAPSRRPGSIPAHAGQPPRAQSVATRPRVHPRSRGATAGATLGAAAASGPSPLTRGNRCCAGAEATE